MTWDGTGTGVLNVGTSDGLEITGDNVRFKNAPSLSEGRLLYWNDVNTQLENAKIVQTSTVTQSGTVYTVTIDAEETVVSGNLTVNGQLTSITSNEVNIGDSIILLNSDLGASTAPTQDGGFLLIVVAPLTYRSCGTRPTTASLRLTSPCTSVACLR